MDANERRIIDELFDKLRQAETYGPRDPDAESHIREQVGHQPAAPYYMAQAIVIQEQALAASQARIEMLERELRTRSSGGFLGTLFGGSRSATPTGTRAPSSGATPGFGDPRVAAHADPRRLHSGGGFLAGAMQTAMGVAGGMLIADALGEVFASDEAIAAESSQAEDMGAAEDADWSGDAFGGEDEEF